MYIDESKLLLVYFYYFLFAETFKPENNAKIKGRATNQMKYNMKNNFFLHLIILNVDIP